MFFKVFPVLNGTHLQMWWKRNSRCLENLHGMRRNDSATDFPQSLSLMKLV